MKHYLFIQRYLGTLWGVLLLIVAGYSFAGDRYITVNDGQHIEVKEPITTVFVSDPEVVDYNVINENTVVVFAKGVGQARFIIYGESKKVLLSDRVIVDIDLSLVRRQLKLFYPE
ncbi:pilus assembly protein N-terminal domain-containing protein, partial [Vibrio owensii]